MLNGGVTQYDLSADSVVVAASVEAKVAYIKQLSQTSPVLVYGSMELCTQLLMSGALFVNTSVNPQQLRALDQRDPFSKAYKIVVCNDMFGMRGIDYRSNSVTLAFVIA